MATKKESESEISIPSQTIRQYTKILDLPLEQSLAHLNSIGFRCYANDEVKIPIRTILDEMYRNLQAKVNNNKRLQEQAEEKKRKILAQVYAGKERAEQLLVIALQKEVLRRQKEAGDGEAKREETLKLRRQEEEINEKLSGLDFKIEKYEDTSMSNGENAFIIYLTVDNKISSSRKINLVKATYVTHKREQLEQDIWLSGYITGEDVLKPNSFKKAGLVFYKNKLKSISDNDIIYITAELPQEGKELTISFKKEENKWQMTQVENTELEIKLSPKQLEKILLKKIERLEVFEERLGVSIQNLSLKIEKSYTWAILYCEVHLINGTKLNESIKIECVLYGIDGSILEKQSEYINKDNFFGFELIQITFTGDIEMASQVSKIRIYPKNY